MKCQVCPARATRLVSLPAKGEYPAQESPVCPRHHNHATTIFARSAVGTARRITTVRLP